MGFDSPKGSKNNAKNDANPCKSQVACFLLASNTILYTKMQ